MNYLKIQKWMIENIINNVNIRVMENNLLNMLKESYKLYLDNGSRSSKKTDKIHKWFQYKISEYLKDKPEFVCKVEYKIKSFNFNSNKRIDIVILKNNIPYIIFPVKFICSNYKQNRNNYWENLNGECTLIKIYNENLKIIPINIFLKKCPYFLRDHKIKNFEKITINNIKQLYKIHKKLPFDNFLNILINNDNEDWNNPEKFRIELNSDLYKILDEYII